MLIDAERIFLKAHYASWELYKDQRMMQHANRGGISSVKIAPIMNLFLEHSAIRPSSTVNVQGKRSLILDVCTCKSVHVHILLIMFFYKL